MAPDEVLSTYMSRVRTTVALLRSGNVTLLPALINLFAVNGLNSHYEAVTIDIALHPERFVSLDLDELETTCRAYAKTLAMVTSATTVSSAAAATPLPPPPATTPPASAVEADWQVVKANLANAATTCPLCIRAHAFTNCDKCHAAGYIVIHDPVQAAEKLKASRALAHQRRHRHHRPTASASATSLLTLLPPTAPAPSTTAPPLPPTPSTTSPPPSPPPDNDEDASALVAAAVHIMDVSYEELSDNENDLVEHPGFPPSRPAAASWARAVSGPHARSTSTPPRPKNPGVASTPGL